MPLILVASDWPLLARVLELLAEAFGRLADVGGELAVDRFQGLDLLLLGHLAPDLGGGDDLLVLDLARARAVHDLAVTRGGLRTRLTGAGSAALSAGVL